MALGAILAEFVIVNVLMTACAVVVPDPFEFLKFPAIPGNDFMAGCTRCFLVFACQPEICFGMVKFYSWFEGINAMTIGAGGGECALVVIHMAGKTLSM
jgi:hypothetical protein